MNKQSRRRELSYVSGTDQSSSTGSASVCIVKNCFIALAFNASLRTARRQNPDKYWFHRNNACVRKMAKYRETPFFSTCTQKKMIPEMNRSEGKSTKISVGNFVDITYRFIHSFFSLFFFEYFQWDIDAEWTSSSATSFIGFMSNQLNVKAWLFFPFCFSPSSIYRQRRTDLQH